MTVTTLDDPGLGNAAHVVDLGDGGALVVDPARDPRPVARELDRRGLAVRFVVETHLHADFVSGGRELAALGARLLAPAGSRLAFAHRALDDGEEVDLGGLVMEVVATPGHTPEHQAFLLRDGHRPVAVFTGGTLMAGGVARPDLLSPEQTEPLARAAYRSVRERLFTLPDDLPVHPTHGGGSFCSSVPGGSGSTTIGQERATNPLFADDPDEDTFVRRLLGDLGSFPPYFLELRDVNRAGTPVHGPRPPRLAALSPEEVASARAGGAEVVDARPMQAFAGGHVPGSLSIPWRDQFATWLGWLVPRDRPMVLVADETVDRDDLVWSALTIGHERLVGELAGGVDAWATAGHPLATTPVLEGPDAKDGRSVVDVRQAPEHAAGHVPGATHVELGRVADSEVPGGPVLVHCGHGERAMSAASLLERAGRRDVAVLAGGPESLGPLER